jgi:hypothetical protein
VPPPFSRIKRQLLLLHLPFGHQPRPVQPFAIAEPADQPGGRRTGEEADDARRRVRQVIVCSRRMVDTVSAALVPECRFTVRKTCRTRAGSSVKGPDGLGVFAKPWQRVLFFR